MVLEETDDYIIYKVGQPGYVPIGQLVVRKRDIVSGEYKGKAGASNMAFTEGFPPPSVMALKKKYRVA
tara:strand:- start:258 stop:461 length:204 start_codon:yes stop_codon:yes gene_type:complete